MNSVRLLPKRFLDSGHPEEGLWGRWADFVIRRPVPVALIGLAIVGALVYCGVHLNPSEAQAKDLPGAGDAIDGRDGARGRRHLRRRATSRSSWSSEQRREPRRPSSRSSTRRRASSARSRRPGRTGAGARRAWSRRSRDDGRRRRAPNARHDRPRSSRSSRAPTRPSAASRAEDRDFVHAVYSKFPYVLGFVVLLTFILLSRAFRSVVLAAEGGRPQPDLARRGLRDHRVHLPVGPRLRDDLGRPRHAVDHPLDPADDLRVPVRPVDGLRGLHDLAHARGLRRDGRHEPRDLARPRPHRQARHERGARS